MNKVDILAIGAHPDDVELCCVGTLIKAIKNKKRVGLVDLTQGELGTRGNATLRMEEAEHSRIKMGAIFRNNLKMPDGFFEINQESLLKVVEQIRFAKPDIILANSLDDRHPDHARAAKLVERANFLAGLEKIKTTYKGKEQSKWRAKAVFHYIQDKNLHPDFVIDISDEIDTKMECIKCFGSQFFDLNSNESETPLTGSDYFDYLKGKAKTYGRHIGAEYGEGFNTTKYLGVRDITQLY